LSSSLEDVAFSTSSLLKTIKNTPFIKISFPRALFYTSNLFFSLEGKRLKLFANCFVKFSITFECLHPNIVIMFSSISLACSFASLF
jgi:hypothetical protein